MTESFLETSRTELQWQYLESWRWIQDLILLSRLVVANISLMSSYFFLKLHIIFFCVMFWVNTNFSPIHLKRFAQNMMWHTKINIYNVGMFALNLCPENPKRSRVLPTLSRFIWKETHNCDPKGIFRTLGIFDRDRTLFALSYVKASCALIFCSCDNEDWAKF